MADNINVTPGAGATIAADDIGGALHQRVKLVVGADGVSDGDVSTANPMPTTLTALEQSYLSDIATNTGAQAIDFISSGTITALNGSVLITGQGVYTITAAISGTWTGTLVFEGQMADLTWQILPANLISTTLPWNAVFSTTTNGNFTITGGGYLSVRVRASVYTSGTVSVSFDGSLSQQTVFSGQLGAWQNASTDGLKATYSAAVTTVTGFSAANNPTDIFTLTGSATKTVRVLKVIFSATQTTGAVRDVLFLRRSTANTGASNAMTAVTHDTANAAATATAVFYTANPTVGTLVGNIKTIKAWIPATTAQPGVYEYTFGANADQAIVLRGTSQVFAINLSGVTSAGNSIHCAIDWTEE